MPRDWRVFRRYLVGYITRCFSNTPLFMSIRGLKNADIHRGTVPGTIIEELLPPVPLFSHQPFDPLPAPVTELWTFPVGVPDPGGEIHNASGILAMSETHGVSQLMDRLGHDPHRYSFGFAGLP